MILTDQREQLEREKGLTQGSLSTGNSNSNISININSNSNNTHNSNSSTHSNRLGSQDEFRDREKSGGRTTATNDSAADAGRVDLINSGTNSMGHNHNHNQNQNQTKEERSEAGKVRVFCLFMSRELNLYISIPQPWSGTLESPDFLLSFPTTTPSLNILIN